MKILLTCLTITLFSSNLFAGTVNLRVGEMINISANTPMTVICGGSESTCTTAVKNLSTKFDYCNSTGTLNIEECLQDLWPKFKRANAQCVEDAYNTCLNFCKRDPFGLDCLKLCQ
jgi:hypothetical protein